MRATAHRGCTDTVRESALTVDSGRKIPCRTGEWNLQQRRAGPTLHPPSYSPNFLDIDRVHRNEIMRVHTGRVEYVTGPVEKGWMGEGLGVEL